MNAIRRFLAPAAPQGEEQRYARTVLNVISLSAVAATGVFMAVTFAIHDYTAGIVTVIAFAIALALLWLTALGRLTVPRFAYPLVSWGVATALVATSDGVRNEAMFVFPLTIVFAGLLHGRRGILTYTLLGIGSITVLGYGEVAGWRVTRFSWGTDLATFLNYDALLVLMGGLLYVTIDSLARSLAGTRRKEAELAERNRELLGVRASLEEQVTQRTRHAEEARRAAEDARAALEEQVWQTAGQAALHERMRGEQDVATLAGHVIGQLCRQLRAPVGTLFLLDGGVLRLAGGFAYAPAAGTPAEFRLGEGLPGQAALEKRTLRLAGVPASYLTVTSGLGDAPPAHLLIAPFLYEEQVVGVVEIGTLDALTEAQAQFVAQAMETVGIAFNTVRARGRIDQLLQQTQQQAEELQAQEEELRAINEELAARAESLQAPAGPGPSGAEAHSV